MALDKYQKDISHEGFGGGIDSPDQDREFTSIVRQLDDLRCHLYKLNEMASGIAGRVFGSEDETDRPANSPNRRDGALGAVDICLHDCEVAARDISEQLSRLDRL